MMRLWLVMVGTALLLSACGPNLAYQNSPYEHGCAFTRDCGPGGGA